MAINKTNKNDCGCGKTVKITDRKKIVKKIIKKQS
jgi:hypothetical protein